MEFLSTNQLVLIVGVCNLGFILFKTKVRIKLVEDLLWNKST